MKLKNLLLVIIISATTAVGSVWGFSKYQETNLAGTQESDKLPLNYASFYDKSTAPQGPLDFTAACASATPAVVHIRIKTKARTITNNNAPNQNPFGDLFGDGSPFGNLFGGPGGQQTIPSQRASGSGVIISQDGYIITNNHVVQDAAEITVTTSDKKTYKARVIGTDPNYDLAVVKIDAKNLPYLVYGNSDNVKLGQWVLAIGYPFTLDVTVTAGIVSAKARDIGLGRQDNGGASSIVQSYIQTDAAVNPGNSGGALINTDGQLIGINSAIASETGSYSGYSFAIPVNIVKKVTNDLIKYGAVQRGYLGVEYGDISSMPEEAKDKLNIKNYNTGIYVSSITKDGAAEAAGLKKGDVITKIDNIPVDNSGELAAVIGDKKPGDKIVIDFMRDGKEHTTNATLKNNIGDVVATANKDNISTSALGASLNTLNAEQLSKYGISGGVQVKDLSDGALKKAGVENNFIIFSINGTRIKTAEQALKIIKSATGDVVMRGFYPGSTYIYGYRFNLGDSDNNDSGY